MKHIALSFLLLVLAINPLYIKQSHAKTIYEQESIVFGFPPIYEKNIIESGFKPFMEYLSRELGQPVKLYLAKDNAELADRLNDNKVQIALFGGTAYVEAKRKYPDIQYLATAQTLEHGIKQSYYYGHIITLKDSPYKNLKDLINTRFAYASKESTSGYKFPRVYFYKKRIQPERYFSELIFAGSHAKLTDMLANREINAGSTYDVNLSTAIKKHGDIFKTIVKLGPITNLALVSNHQLSQDLLAKIIAALLIVPPEIVAADFPYAGFEILSDSDYDPIREVTFTESTSSRFYDEKIFTILTQKRDLNKIYAFAYSIDIEKDDLITIIRNNLVGKIVNVYGKPVDKIKRFNYNNNWARAENVLVLEVENRHKVYLINTGNIEMGQAIMISAKVVGQKGNEVVLDVLSSK
ncbi:MAG: phosphate/phosphite/phosphonate ABC transporter substrate-binding protein [gamma proteobacterium symbiont of Taylorina sp.]|nr:phosphate/phosphite/phosphonate ABC transporter substrate-binding protein [gamma proteobacterium symbiont of Taylorina sp.]